jgi:hypothetical protein
MMVDLRTGLSQVDDGAWREAPDAAGRVIALLQRESQSENAGMTNPDDARTSHTQVRRGRSGEAFQDGKTGGKSD